LPAAPLVERVEAAATTRGVSIRSLFIGQSGLAQAFYRAKADGKVTLLVAERFCDEFGWHGRMLWGDAYDRLACQVDRQTILEILEDADGELSAREIASHFAVSLPSICQHLNILLGAGLVEARQGTVPNPQRGRPTRRRPARLYRARQSPQQRAS
jgi:DNA-binding transcriptional ArsR family regulator